MDEWWRLVKWSLSLRVEEWSGLWNWEGDPCSLHAARVFVHYVISLDISNNNGVDKLQLFVLEQKMKHYDDFLLFFFGTCSFLYLYTLYFTPGNLLRISFFPDLTKPWLAKLLITQTSAANSTIHGCSSIKECGSEDKKPSLSSLYSLYSCDMTSWRENHE